MTNLDDMDLNLDPIAFKALFKTKPYIHAFALLYNWVIIFASIALSLQFPNPLLYFLVLIIIGARVHALAILTHDAAHYRFLKNRTWNDLLSNYFTMYPLFLSVEKYRKNHLEHHKHLNTEDDPDWVAKLGARAFQFPKTKKEFLLTLGSYLLFYPGIMDALWFLKRFGVKKKQAPIPLSKKLPKIIFYIGLISSLTYFGLWKIYLLYWIAPYFSTFFMFQYIRSVAEHFGELAYDDLLSSSRTVKTSFIEEFFIAPHNVGYHLEHHLYPGVPFYHLPKLHELLMQQPGYKNKAHITNGYTMGLLQELGKVG